MTGRQVPDWCREYAAERRQRIPISLPHVGPSQTGQNNPQPFRFSGAGRSQSEKSGARAVAATGRITLDRSSAATAPSRRYPQLRPARQVLLEERLSREQSNLSFSLHVIWHTDRR